MKHLAALNLCQGAGHLLKISKLVPTLSNATLPLSKMLVWLALYVQIMKLNNINVTDDTNKFGNYMTQENSPN